VAAPQSGVLRAVVRDAFAPGLGMIHRRVFTADIVRERISDVTRASVLNDFATGPRRAVGRESLELAFPCIFDIPRARTLYALGLDTQELQQAPFANVHARIKARSILSVPWEAGPINRPRIEADPIYVFSSGRCGSTLLHNILLAAEIPGVSEPDVGAGLLSLAYWKYPPLRPVLRWATRTYVRDLMSALAGEDQTLVVKLRSQYCAAAPALLKKSRERRTIFMTRRFEDWAQSVGRMFQVTAASLLGEYCLSLNCYAYLRQHSDCHFLRYEDLVSQPHREMARLSEFLGREISAQAVDRAMSVGSQTGTRLERVTERGKARWDTMKDEVYRQWISSGSADHCSQILQAYE
jgi:hypothetical protein